MKSQVWTFLSNGNEHKITFTPALFKPAVLEADGKALRLKANGWNNMIGLDQSFIIDSKEIHFILRGSKGDVAVDGFYIGSKKPYAPLTKPPKWIYVFAVLCALIPVITLGGAFPFVLGFLGIVYCFRISVLGIDAKLKILCCGLITAAAWALLYLIPFLIYS